MSQVVRYRQYWMATLKDRHWCQICGELAINALEYLDMHGVCESVSWICDRDNSVLYQKNEMWVPYLYGQ